MLNHSAHLRLVLMFLFLLKNTASAEADDADISFWNWLLGVFCLVEPEDTGCGLFGLGKTMVLLSPAVDNEIRCQEEICSYVPFLNLLAGYSCGACSSFTAAPTAAPSSMPSMQPTTKEEGLRGFDIFLDLEQVPEVDEGAFTAARKRWQKVVTGGLPNIESQQIIAAFGLQGFPPAGCRYPELIDDVYICAKETFIDGVDGILGQAGPRVVRDGTLGDSGLALTGIMIFDSADIEVLRTEGQLDSVVRMMERYSLAKRCCELMSHSQPPSVFSSFFHVYVQILHEMG